MNEKEREQRKMEIRTRLSAQMRFWQRHHNMDVDKLADKTGMAKNSIYRLKRGDAGATIDTLVVLGDAFEIPPCVLLMPLEVDNGVDE